MRALNFTSWPTGDIRKHVKVYMRISPTSYSTSRCKIFTQVTFSINIKIIAHKPPVAKKTEAPSFFPAREYVVPILSYFRVNDGFFVVPPKPLDSACAFVFISHVVSESTLNASSHIMPVPIPHCFKGKKLQECS